MHGNDDVFAQNQTNGVHHLHWYESVKIINKMAYLEKCVLFHNILLLSHLKSVSKVLSPRL